MDESETKQRISNAELSDYKCNLISMLRIANEVSLHTGHFREIPRGVCKPSIYFHFRSAQCILMCISIYAHFELWYAFPLHSRGKRMCFRCIRASVSEIINRLNPSISQSTRGRPYSQATLISFSPLLFLPEIRMRAFINSNIITSKKGCLD